MITSAAGACGSCECTLTSAAGACGACWTALGRAAAANPDVPGGDDGSDGVAATCVWSKPSGAGCTL
eukprot:1833287-Lingulodinium_polyedra.AAC.1